MKRATLVATVMVLAVASFAIQKSSAAEPAPATQPTTKPASPLAIAKQKALEQYKKILNCYMHSDFIALKVEMARMRSAAMLPKADKSDLAYIRRMIPEYRPIWWKHCRSASNISFRAKIWGRPFVANFMPTQPQSKRQAVQLVNNKIQVIAQWQPHRIDNPQPITGALAVAHELTQGHVGEAIVWYELGRNYVPTFLPVKQAVFLYQKEATMFSHVQEFLAGMSSLYHSSPKARLASLFIQIDSLKKNEGGSAYTRAGHAVGAMILARVLTEPDQWPAFKLPTEVPKTMVEITTILHIYNRIDPEWSLAEDKSLRDFAGKFILTRGKSILKSKGTIVLPSKLSMKLMATHDRQSQALRDAWVAKKLKAIIEADKKDKAKDKDKDKAAPGKRTRPGKK
ncbi:MAG: hypothetical protein QGH60_20880 [Phycisphaerae bacterium]|jgi:hypothetical protein|nr:hypothetical protein [Phycisphaerae bacterium]